MLNMLTVPRLSATDIAHHYGVDEHALRQWIGRNRNVSLLGTIDSPAMVHTVARFLRVGRLSDAQVRREYALAREAGRTDIDVENEYRGRGLMRTDAAEFTAFHDMLADRFPGEVDPL